MDDDTNEYLEQLKVEEMEDLAANEDIIQSFIKICEQKGITLGKNNFRFIQTTGTLAVYPDLLQLLFPELKKDKEGLYNFKKLVENFKVPYFTHGYLDGGHSWLMAHPFFRRGFHELNNWAPRFVEKFWSLRDPGIEAYIALDPDRVKIDIARGGYRELDTWYGASFKDSIASIPDGVVKIRPPADLKDHHLRFFFESAFALDLAWKTNNGIKVFEAEELKMADVYIEKDGSKFYPVRYIHAEFDIRAGHFRHFDGAIHYYTEEEYYQRRDSDLNYNSKHLQHIKTSSEKLFKFNGIISIGFWIEMCCQFMTGNPLTFEYFEGQYPQHIVELLEKVRAINPKPTRPNQ